MAYVAVPGKKTTVGALILDLKTLRWSREPSTSMFSSQSMKERRACRSLATDT